MDIDPHQLTAHLLNALRAAHAYASGTLPDQSADTAYFTDLDAWAALHNQLSGRVLVSLPDLEPTAYASLPAEQRGHIIGDARAAAEYAATYVAEINIAEIATTIRTELPTAATAVIDLANDDDDETRLRRIYDQAGQVLWDHGTHHCGWDRKLNHSGPCLTCTVEGRFAEAHRYAPYECGYPLDLEDATYGEPSGEDYIRYVLALPDTLGQPVADGAEPRDHADPTHPD